MIRKEKIRFESVLQVATPNTNGDLRSDGFSGLINLHGGIYLAGKRWSSLLVKPSPLPRFWRSVDNCQNWSALGAVTGSTGNNVYGFDTDGAGVVLCGTGEPSGGCLMRSPDYGATWSVILTEAQLKTLCSATIINWIQTCRYMGAGRWLCPVGNDQRDTDIIESLDNGLTFHAFPTGLRSAMAKLVRTSNGDLLGTGDGVVADWGVYLSHDLGTTFVRKTTWKAYSPVCELASGAYLVGTVDNSLAIPSTVFIHKSIDGGDNWTVKLTLSVGSPLASIQNIVEIEPGLIVAFVNYSYQTMQRGCRMMVSTDDGETWSDQRELYFGQYGAMVSVHKTAFDDDGYLLLACMPNSNILRSL